MFYIYCKTCTNLSFRLFVDGSVLKLCLAGPTVMEPRPRVRFRHGLSRSHLFQSLTGLTSSLQPNKLQSAAKREEISYAGNLLDSPVSRRRHSKDL
jgi:hypothetical protein